MQKNGIVFTSGTRLQFPQLRNLKFLMRVGLFAILGILLTAQFIIASPGFGQSNIQKSISLKVKNESLSQVFREIEELADITISYEFTMFDKSEIVTLTKKNAKVSDVLDFLLSSRKLQWKEKDNVVFISAANPVRVAPTLNPPAISPVLEIPPITIRGRIVNENSEPVVASVLIKGTTNGVTSNVDGYFELVVPTEQSVLIVSGVGIETREISVSGSAGKELSISVNTKASEETEAVVTGYGTQRKKDIIGSVAVVDVKALKSIPAGSALQALQGQASGVNIIASGSPGHASNIRIRGVSSFGNTNPLVLIDGIQGNLNDIPGDDVESIQVLKDAGAAAIYGVRGANGVIIVTTKKGKSGNRGQTTYDSYYGVQKPVSSGWDMMNTEEYAQTINKVNPTNAVFADGFPDFMWRGPGGSGVGAAGDAAVNPSKYYFDPSNSSNNYLIQRLNRQGTDWFNEIFSPALMMNHNLSTAGGTDRLNYMVSLGYMNQQGVLMNTHMKRYSLRVNTEYKLRKNIRLGENMYAFYRDNPQENPNHPYFAINGARSNLPFIPVRDIMGNWGGGYAGPGLGPSGNPVALRAYAANNRSRELALAGNVYAEIDFLKNFTARTSIGGNINSFYRETFTGNNYFHGEQFNNKNSLNENSGYGSLLMWTNTLSYKKTLDRHSFSALAGTESISINSRNQTGGRQNFYSEDYNFLVLGNGTSNLSNSSAAGDDAFYSVFGRLDYSYDDRYLVGLTLRRDGSSRFGSQKRYGVFPSVTAGWRVSSERFMQNVHWVNDLKLRASYGVIGNAENVSVTNASTLYSQSFYSSYYDINGTSTDIVQGFQPSNIGNPKAEWEKNVVTNFGLDATLFNRKLDFSIEYFNKRIEGLLFGLPLPSSISGTATTPTVNIGDIKNSGVDFSATYHARLGNDMRLDIGGNITAYKNVIGNIPTPGYFDPAWTPGNSVRNQEGQAVSAFYGYRVVSLFESQHDVDNSPVQDGAAPGRFKYQDVNGDGTINPSDRTFIGNPNPDFVYGINIAFSFKKFDVSTIFYGSQGNDIWNETRRYSDFMAGGITNKSRRLLNAWTPENTGSNIPKLEAGPSFSTLNAPNSYFIEDGSYLRMRSLVVGYTFDVSRLQKAGITRLRVYAQAANLFTITNYSGADPEITSYRTQTFGIDEGYYPNVRNILFGLNIGF